MRRALDIAAGLAATGLALMLLGFVLRLYWLMFLVGWTVLQ